MEKIGLLSDIVLTSSLSDWETKRKLEQTNEFQDNKNSLNTTLHALKQIAKANDIDELIRSERLLLGLEKTVHKGIDKTVTSSLDAALEDFRVMEKALYAVRSGSYEIASDSHHSKKKLHNIPADGFHEGIKSHITRLSNRLRTVGISVPEKNVLRQRQQNMRTAKELYIDLQRKALDLEVPKLNKSKGLSR